MNHQIRTIISYPKKKKKKLPKNKIRTSTVAKSVKKKGNKIMDQR